MFNQYEGYFVFGKNGRFGSILSQSLKDKYLNVFEYSTGEFYDGVSSLIRHLRVRRSTCVVWCLGAGNSKEESVQSREYQLLSYLLSEMVKERLPVSNSLFIYLSTGGKMYGINPGVVWESSKILPVGSYGQQKKNCEQLIKEMVSFFFRSHVFRLANAYSLSFGNVHPKGFIENCLSAIESNKAITFTVNPGSQRQFSSHRDYVNVILNNITQISDSPYYSVCNLAPDFTYSLHQIISSFEDYFGRQVRIESFEPSKLIDDSVILRSEKKEIVHSKLDWNSIEQNLECL